MTRNYIARTIAEALEQIKAEHGPDATIIKVWEFQRRSDGGFLENWVGVSVDPSLSTQKKAENRVTAQPAETPTPRIQTFTKIRAKWQAAGASIGSASASSILKAPEAAPPIDPESASQSQVMKAKFKSQWAKAQNRAPAEAATHPLPPPGEEKEAYREVGGLDKELAQLREMIEYPLKYPQMFQKLGIDAPRGVLLCGPPGCGKTLLARSIARATQAHFQVVNGPELVGAYQGESEANLRKVFEEAEKNSPSIIFFDEIDSITPKRDEATGPEKRLVTQLLTLMDGIESRGQVIVIASTNTPDSIDSALRRPGRFDREIWIRVPDAEARKKILDVHTAHMALDKDVELKTLAERTHGFVGADLSALCREAGLRAIREALPGIKDQLEESEANLDDSTRQRELLSQLRVRRKHFESALKEVKPSSLRNQQTALPDIHWKEIGGLDKVKADLEEAVIWPIRHPEIFIQADVKPPRGILLAGPPGCGKTLLAKALASESGINFISIKGPELVSKYVGESEKAIREIFQQARQAAPCILFFDEVDAIAPARGADPSSSQFGNRLVAQMLVEMDGIEKLNQVLVLGATNRPDEIDPALRRPGRFDRVIEIPLPEEASRLEILKVHTERKPLDPSIDLSIYAAQTEGFSGADLEAVCRLAALASVRRALIAPRDKTSEPLPSESQMLTIIYPSDFDAAVAETRQQVQKRLVKEIAAHAADPEDEMQPEELPASASQFFYAHQNAQRERIRGESTRILLN